MTPLYRSQEGFSLTEMLVAITLLGVGLLAVAGMQTVALNRGGISFRSSTATSLAHEAMDDIMSWDVNSHAQLATSSSGEYARDVSIEGGGVFTITYTTTKDTPQAGTTKVVVTVRAAGNPSQPVTVTSYKKVV